MSAMTIYHIHHIVPKHVGGSDDSSNLVKLTIEEHAEAHRILYEKYGRWQDEVAWKSLSNQISCAEATKISQSLANKGENNYFHHSKGNINPMYGKKGELSPHFGKKHSEETNRKKRMALIGRSFEDLHGKEKAEKIKDKFRKPKTEEHKQKLRKPKPKVVCRIKDRKEMSLGNFMNWNKNGR
jgi:hypothetical protein